ncbi:hypothetical protein TNCV_1700421 [Trichonephila clavipes]|nr:hypothetical protein TNCV_1700421 [Trichonephila clavipes]
MKFYFPHVRLFRGAVGDKFVLWTTTQHVIEHSLFRIVSDSEGIQRLVCPARSPDLNPIENVDAWGGKLLVETILRQTRTPSSVHSLTEEWDKLPQQLLDNVVQSMVRHGMLHHTPRWTYPVLIPFFKVPADF